MKNPQVKQGQCDSNMFPQNTFLSMLQVTARPLPCWQQNYLLFLCPNLSQNSISCSAYLWGVLVKNRGGLGIFQILLKKRFSHLSWQPSLLGDNLTMWLFFLHPLVSPRREYTWTPLESIADWFISKTSRMFFILTRRNSMIDAFIILTLPPHVRDSL